MLLERVSPSLLVTRNRSVALVHASIPSKCYPLLMTTTWPCNDHVILLAPITEASASHSRWLLCLHSLSMPSTSRRRLRQRLRPPWYVHQVRPCQSRPGRCIRSWRSEVRFCGPSLLVITRGVEERPRRGVSRRHGGLHNRLAARCLRSESVRGMRQRGKLIHVGIALDVPRVDPGGAGVPGETVCVHFRPSTPECRSSTAWELHIRSSVRWSWLGDASTSPTTRNPRGRRRWLRSQHPDESGHPWGRIRPGLECSVASKRIYEY
jgi:hypothetical protein